MSPEETERLLLAIWRALPTEVRVLVVVAGTLWTTLLLWGLLR